VDFETLDKEEIVVFEREIAEVREEDESILMFLSPFPFNLFVP
jgi:hypothetical protein